MLICRLRINCMRLLNFVLSYATSGNNIIVRMCYYLACNGSHSVSVNNITYLAGRCGKCRPAFLTIANFSEWLQNCLQPHNRTSCQINASVMIRYMLNVLDMRRCCNSENVIGFSAIDATTLLNSLSVD